MTIMRAISAGHICLDINPDLSTVPSGKFGDLLQPGKMVRSGRIDLRAGGAAANTGLVMDRLGIPVKLIGKIGDDLFGSALKAWIESQSVHLADDLVVDLAAPTGYSIIVNFPGDERTIIHNPGANDVFYASDLPRAVLQEADLFHFGYPTLMRSVYRGEGGELVSIMQRARRAGLSTSLDVSLPDSDSNAGLVDWFRILSNSLPLVDIFTPDAAELAFMLEPERYQQLLSNSSEPFLQSVTPEMLHEWTDILLGWGVKLVLVKLGERGLYLRTAKVKSWERAGRGLSELSDLWINRELWAPAFNVSVEGTTGAGDAATGGFLASLLRGQSPELALVISAGTGGVSVENAECSSSVISWEGILERIKKGWEVQPLDLTAYGWKQIDEFGIWQNA